MATVAESITWTTHEGALREAIGVVSGEDARLQRLLESATAAADAFLANPFLDDDGITDLAIPGGVEEGVYVWVYAARAASLTTGPSPSTASVTTGAASESHFAPSCVTATQIALNAARPHWLPYRKNVWR